MEVLFGILIPFIGTTLGSACVFFMKRSLGDLVQRALAAVICVLPERKPAYTTPTAIPSGILCKVTASTIMVVRPSLLFGPSACSLPT